MPKKDPKQTPPTVLLKVRIPRDLKDRLAAVASTDGRTMAWVVKAAIKEYLSLGEDHAA